MKCDHCGYDVPEGVFCTRCGAHQGTGSDLSDPKSRTHSYAAHPGEHVAHAGMFTTLFPHLGHHKIHQFRWTFLVGAGLVVLLNVTGYNTAAILISTLLIPILYLMYLYEAQVYKEEPVRVLGLLFGGGIVLGVIVTVVLRMIFPAKTGGFGTGVVEAGSFLIPVFAIPIIQEIVKPLPALALRGREGFSETVDGLVFGVAAGLGFGLAVTLIEFGAVLGGPTHGPSGNWIYTLITIGVLQPLMQGSATGAIVAAFWRMGRGRFGMLEIGAIAVAFLAHILFAAAQTLIPNADQSALIVVIAELVIVGALLIYIRYVLHTALLDEAAHMGFVNTMCPNCHRHINASGFCPSCGKALTAAPNAVAVGAAAPSQTAVEGA